MTDPTLADRARRFALAVVARDLLSEVATNLATIGIDVMPLKGVLLQALVYDDPTERPMVDVDVAVRSVDFLRASAALQGSGFRVELEGPGLYQIALSRPGVPLGLDLHRRFAAARRFRMTPDDFFARGRRDEALFGFPVVLPDDYDLYAHLLAHASLDYAMGEGWHRPGDLRRLAQVRRLDSGECARRIDEHGLGRLARVCLAPGTPGGDDAFGRDVRARLSLDPVGSALARLAGAVYSRDGSWLAARRAMALLLNPTLREAGLALAEGLLSRAGRLAGRG